MNTKFYESKRDTTIKAKVVEDYTNERTVMLEYIVGKDRGKTVSITQATFKRWWKLVDTTVEESETVEELQVKPDILKIDYDKVNEPYPEPKVQKYVPKPQSVIEYEAKKNKLYNKDLPDFEQFVEDFGPMLVKVNEKSKYVMFNTKSTMWRKQSIINIYACESDWEKLTNSGLQSKPNKDTARPFAFDIHSKEEYEKVKEALNV